MVSIIKNICICFSLAIFWWYTIAQTAVVDPLTLPPMTQLVTDYSAVLDPTTLQSLNLQAQQIETETTAQIATALIPHRQGNELFDIGSRLFRESGIGQKETNNGVLLVIVTDEKKLRLFVGYGLEGAFPDIAASELIETTLRPLVDAGKRAEAIDAYQTALTPVAKGEKFSSPTTGNEYELTVRDILFFFLRCLGTISLFKHLGDKKKKKTKQFWPILPFFALFLLIILALPGILWAFFGYIAGLFVAIFSSIPSGGWGHGYGYTPWSSGGRGGGGWWGGFGWFGGGSFGGGGAGD